MKANNSHFSRKSQKPIEEYVPHDIVEYYKNTIKRGKIRIFSAEKMKINICLCVSVHCEFKIQLALH